MDSRATSTLSPDAPLKSAAGGALQELVGGERGRVLKSQLASWHRKATPEAIEDAVQTACKRFLEHAEGISAPGQVYAWVRTTASRLLDQEEDRGEREWPFDPTGEYRLASVPDEDPGPAEALIELEDGADMEMLVREVSSSLSQRARDVLALYGAGLRRPQIAERLGVSERAVKKNLEEIMEEARAALARLAGGGCAEGEALVLRAACGLATSVEEARTHKHLAGCDRCQTFSDRLLVWRDKAGAVLPAPVAEQADPGLLERAAHKVATGFSSAKQQILDGGAQLKQQATSVSSRAIDPTPIAAVRPGPALAVVLTGCLALGGAGAATYYCVQEGVDPLGAAEGLIAQSEPDGEEAPAPDEDAEAPVYTPAEPTEVEPEPEPTPTPEATPTESTPEATKPREQDPPPEDSFEPVSPSYQSSESEPVESYESPAEPAPVETEPTPAPAAAGPQFGGP